MNWFKSLFGHRHAGARPMRAQTRRLAVEVLEARVTPSHGWDAGAFAGNFPGPAAHVRCGDPDNGGGSQSTQNITPLTAILNPTGSPNTGSGLLTFTFGTQAGTNQLQVQVSGLQADTSYKVLFNGNSFTNFNTDANGNATLQQSNLSPALTAGGSVTVMSSAGTFVLAGTTVATTSQDNGCCHHHCDN